MAENEDMNDAVSAADMEKIKPSEEQPPPPVGDEHVPVDTDPGEDAGDEAGDEKSGDLGQDQDQDDDPDGGATEGK